MEHPERGHLTASEVQSLLDGSDSAGETLPPSVQAELRTHLTSCQQCSELFTDYERADRRLHYALNGPPPPLADAGRGCPDEAAWSTLGSLPPEEAARLLDHALDCPHCSALAGAIFDEPEAVPITAVPALRSSALAWQRQMAKRMAAATQRRMHLWPTIAAIAAALAIAAGVGYWRQLHGTESLLAKAYSARRPFEFRLPDDGYSRVATQRGAGSMFGTPPSLAEAVRLIEAGLARNPSDVSMLRRKGHAELLDRSYEESLATLEPLYQQHPENQRNWLPLACAYYLRAETQSTAPSEDYARSLDLLTRLSHADPSNAIAAYDRALVLERLQDPLEAIRAWQAFLKLDSASGFADEARRHITALEKQKNARNSVLDAIDADPAKYLALDGDYSRELFLDVAISQWLEKSHEAANRLAREYESQTGDPMLTEIVRQSGPGLAALSRAIILNRSGSPEEGTQLAAGSARRLSGAAALRASFEELYGLHRSGHAEQCSDLASVLERHLARTRYTWLKVQTAIQKGICLSYAGRLSEAIDVTGEAKQMAAGSHLPGLEMRAQAMLGDYLVRTGNTAAFWRDAPVQLARFWAGPYPPNYAHQILFMLRDAAQADGLDRAAYVFSISANEFIAQTDESLIAASGEANSAALARAIGFDAEAAAHESRSRELYAMAPDSAIKRTLMTSGAVFRVASELHGFDAVPSPEVVRTLESLKDDDLRTATAIARRDDLLATSYWRSGQMDRAVVKASELYNRGMEAGVRVYALRQADAAGILSDAALRKGDASGAFRTWQGIRESRVEDLSAQLGDDVFLSWADLPDGLQLFAVSRGVLSNYSLGVHAADLRYTVDSLEALCAQPKSDAGEIQRESQALLTRLLGRGAGSIGTSGTIIVDADGLLGRVPFEVMWPDRVVVRSFGLTEYLKRRGASPVSRASRLVLYGAPAVPKELTSWYPALPESRREVDELARLFSNAVVRTGTDATPAALDADIGSAELFHFAGHGSSNGGNGALVLAPADPSRPYSGLLTADRIARQDWHECRLAVLSACSTAPAGTARRMGQNSLVQSILSAGTVRVVAAHWKVDSESTRALMSIFYSYLLQGVPAAESLQRAERDTRSKPGTSHPYYWGAFEIFGAS